MGGEGGEIDLLTLYLQKYMVLSNRLHPACYPRKMLNRLLVIE